MTAEHSATKRSYLAFTTIGAGGSWARDDSPDAAVARLAKIIVSDWGSLYKLDGVEMKAGVYDVTGRDVRMGYNGVHDEADGTEIERLELRTIKLTAKRCRRVA